MNNDQTATPQTTARPAPPRPSKIANRIVTVGLVGLGLFGAWWIVLRPIPIVSVAESHQTGRLSVEGVVDPPMSEENLAFRALSYRGDDLGFFQVRDATGLLDVYFDPADARLPAEGSRVRVTGRRIEASGGDFSRTRPFVAGEVIAIE